MSKESLNESIFHNGEVLEEGYFVEKISLIYLTDLQTQGLGALSSASLIAGRDPSSGEHHVVKGTECAWGEAMVSLFL